MSAKLRDNNSSCPICGAKVVEGSSANWCPTFHYHQEHVLTSDKTQDVLVAEMFTVSIDGEKHHITFGHLASIFGPAGVSVRALPDPPEEPSVTVWDHLAAERG